MKRIALCGWLDLDGELGRETLELRPLRSPAADVDSPKRNELFGFAVGSAKGVAVEGVVAADSAGLPPAAPAGALEVASVWASVRSAHEQLASRTSAKGRQRLARKCCWDLAGFIGWVVKFFGTLL
ncbi:MAG: hypothetical protein ABMA01_01940 [Chthoniobacteraceae bacterium]